MGQAVVCSHAKFDPICKTVLKIAPPEVTDAFSSILKNYI
jgi:hypothetical protein